MTLRPPTLLPLAAIALALAGCGSSSHSGRSSTASTTSQSSSAGAANAAAGKPGFERVPIEAGAQIASPGTTGTNTVDGISCGATEQLAYHIHAHLQIYASGRPRALPGGIGIPGSTVQQDPQAGPVAVGGQCIYWLHTHAPDGVIHVESPTARIYTLGNFFDEWHQPLTTSQVGSATGRVSAYLNGKPWRHGPRSLPLNPHAVIQLDVGQPAVPYQPMSWAGLPL